MSEEMAWRRFATTGKIMDYLLYASIKNATKNDLEGVRGYAGQYGRLGDNGEGCLR